jgi:hypothetical protein
MDVQPATEPATAPARQVVLPAGDDATAEAHPGQTQARADN